MKYILPSRRCYGISLTNAVTFFSHENCTLETLTLCKEQQTLSPQTLHQLPCKDNRKTKTLIIPADLHLTKPVIIKKISIQLLQTVFVL